MPPTAAAVIDDELLLQVLAVLFTLDPVLAPAELTAVAAMLLEAGFFSEASCG
jgi:hypothetical protein